MRALRLYAGPAARRHIQDAGLAPSDICAVPGAAGGPKGLILGALDRYIFGRWLTQSNQTVDLVGASIGAWRMATACLDDPAAAFERLERDYICQHYAPPAGEKKPSAAAVSSVFRGNLEAFYQGRVAQVLNHPRYRLHIITARGRHILAREQPWRMAVGFLGAWLGNAVQRRVMAAWLERVVFSTHDLVLPFDSDDYRTVQRRLNEVNFMDSLQASCSIPFVLRAVHDIAGAPPGAYWDGGLIDYHLHLNYAGAAGTKGLVLYPHFQKAVIPGWLDKRLTWRHQASAFLDNVLLLAPDPDWVRTLPNGKLPDRTDFGFYGQDLTARIRDWSTATAASVQLAEEFEQWLERPDPELVQAL